MKVSEQFPNALHNEIKKYLKDWEMWHVRIFPVGILGKGKCSDFCKSQSESLEIFQKIKAKICFAFKDVMGYLLKCSEMRCLPWLHTEVSKNLVIENLHLRQPGTLAYIIQLRKMYVSK